MPRPRSKHPTELELQILNILWNAGPLSVRQVQEQLAPDRKLAHTSVITMLNIMTDKGYLSRKRGEVGGFVYQPRVSRRVTSRGMLKDLVDRVFGGSAVDVVMQLLDDRNLDADELKELRKLVKLAADAEAQPPKKEKRP
jgi:predicted transcriptional regulator